MDIYDRQGGDRYRKMIDKVYDGFKRFFPDYTTNKYNDDIGWWAMGCTRAYAITGNRRYLDDAKEMFDYIYNNCTEELGGGIYWNTDRKGKNVCTNAPAAVTAARLSVFLEDQSYLQKSKGLFDWLKEHLYEEETGKVNDTVNIDGSVYKGQFTYNFGTFSRAAYELYLVTNESSYLAYVEKPLDYLLATKTKDGILLSEGTGDGAGFRTIFLRTLNLIAKTSRPDYQDVINQNALAAYLNRRESDKLCGDDWTTPPAEEDIIISVLVGASVSMMQFYKA